MPERDVAQPGLAETPIMPTGSGVADLEIAREIDALDADEPSAEQPDALPDADADDAAVEQIGTTRAANAARDVDNLGMERAGPNDAGVTASGAE